MTGLKKYDQLKAFLAKVVSTISELINENDREGKEAGFRSEASDLMQLALTVEVSSACLSFRVMFEENTR